MSATKANRVSHTPFGSQGTELWETNIYLWVFFLKPVYNSCKLQRLLQVANAKFLFKYSFTLFLRHLDLFWIWCCFQFFLHCIVQPNLVIHFLFHIIFIIRIRLWIFQTVNLYFVCFWNIVFINACKLTGEMPIDWSFFLGVWNSVNSLSVSITDWNLPWSSIQWVCL